MHPKIIAFLRRIVNFTNKQTESRRQRYVIRVVSAKTKNGYNLQAHVSHEIWVRSWPFKWLGTITTHRSAVFVTEPGDNCTFYDRSFDYPVDDQALIDGAIASLEADDEGWEEWIHDHHHRRMRREMRGEN